MSLFSINSNARVKKSKFNLSHEKKLSCKMGELVPVLCEEIVPGDNFRVNSEIMMRFSPMITPVMHRMNVYTHFFFVPNRIVWDDWEDFITGGRQGDKTPQMPAMSIAESTKANFVKHRLGDYLGLPITDGATINQSVTVNSLPFRAYLEIFNEYYQDQNLSDPIDFPKTSGEESVATIATLTEMRKRAWEKDYFTSALPWAQRGASASVPGSPNYLNEAQITANGQPYIPTAGQGTLWARDNDGKLGAVSSVGDAKGIENLESVDVDINDLRKSIKLQEWLERTARGGSRYIEQILSHFGVRSSDARLQRPQYLGGGKNPVVISEVLNTTGPTGATEAIPQGSMAGHGISVGNTNQFKRRFEEHGYVIGIMSVIPKIGYNSQGIHKHWTRRSKFDYFWPEFANLGEQEVKNQELYMDFSGAAGQRQETFGYQSRYAEYKYGCSSTHGDFRDKLNFWHMSRIFSQAPALNQSFVESDPTKRIFAVTDPQEDELYVQIYNNVSAIRPMPYFGTPKL